VSLFGSQKGIFCCKNDGVQRPSQQQCHQFLHSSGPHLQFMESSVLMLVFDTVQEFLSEANFATSHTNNVKISRIQGVSRLVDITARGDSLGVCNQKVHTHMCPILDGYGIMGNF
jgi:hypothetical protein